MRFVLVAIIFSFLIPLNGGADALIPLGHPTESKMIHELWDVSTRELQAQTIKSYDQGPIRVEEVYYYSRPYKGKPVKIFGYYCFPSSRKGKLPAILLSHGGGGTASRPRAVSWASRGYAVLAIDLPGKGENRTGSRSSGPDMDVLILLRTTPDLTYNYLIHAVAAARNGITYLSQRKEVDPERIGMVGLSWGGVLTLLTNGQDQRLKAAVNVFGAGYIPEGCTWEDWFTSMSAQEKELWNNYIDPKNFLLTQHAPILFITGTNDHCYYLPTFQKSYEEVKAEKRIWLIPNLKHRFLASAAEPALAWLDQKLKWSPATKKPADSFPTIEMLPPFQKDESKIIIPVRVAVHSSVHEVFLYYTTGGPQQWTQKVWKQVAPYEEDGIYYFGIPSKRVQPEILYYASVKDDHGGAASSLVRSLFSVETGDGARTYATSAPINMTYYHREPIRLLDGLDTTMAPFVLIKKGNNYRLQLRSR
jgi:cephalosporin-C deacetylase-like acetyl esterase